MAARAHEATGCKHSDGAGAYHVRAKRVVDVPSDNKQFRVSIVLASAWMKPLHDTIHPPRVHVKRFTAQNM